MLWLCLALFFTDIPRPIGSWQVSFHPDIVLLKASGESLLFSGQELYTYDEDGVLKARSSLELVAVTAFVGATDSIWIHDGQGLLACLNDNYSIRWQRDVAPPTIPPVTFGDYLLYVNGDLLSVLNAADGSARFSLRHEAPLASVLTLDGWVLLSDASGKTVAWEPLTEKREVRFEGAEGFLQFITRSPYGEHALVRTNGFLDVRRGDMKRLWKRQFFIDIPLEPVWLSGKKHNQVVVATQGRNIYAFGGSSGDQRAKRLIKGRPGALVAWSKTLALVVPELIPELIWYDIETQAFTKEQLTNRLDWCIANGSFLLMVDGDAIIRLYQKPEPR